MQTALGVREVVWEFTITSRKTGPVLSKLKEKASQEEMMWWRCKSAGGTSKLTPLSAVETRRTVMNLDGFIRLKLTDWYLNLLWVLPECRRGIPPETEDCKPAFWWSCCNKNEKNVYFAKWLHSLQSGNQKRFFGRRSALVLLQWFYSLCSADLKLARKPKER